ncbi:MAG TPA: sugar phosphate isomerase/epimerase [Terriglobia bacterium]|nr:sugar phosphate isomerase/epimerase [Terriglobia bacterium]
MRDTTSSRRRFLSCAGKAAAASLACAGALQVARSSGRAADRARSLRLGGPVFIKSDDPAVLAQAHRELGYRAAYAPEVKLADRDRIKSIIKEFSSRDVAIAEVGAWRNMLDPDSEKRRDNMAFVQERLALAEELGARCCVDIAGSFNPTFWCGPNPRNITGEFVDATVENCRKLIDAVKPRRTKFSIEMMPFNFPTGPDDYLRLIHGVDRQAFAVHLDVCNVMNSPERMYRNGDVIRECFDKLGRWVVSCHAKDLKWEDYVQVSLREVIPGRGEIDYKAYLTGLSQLPTDAPLMLEHLKTAEEYAEGRNYIQKVANSLGLSFG